jgi:hypothetical protein
MGRRRPQTPRETWRAEVESLRRDLEARGCPRPTSDEKRLVPFRFTDDARRRLMRVLGIYVVDVAVVVTLLQLRAESYLRVRPSGIARSRHNLRAVQTAAAALADRLGALDGAATEAVLDAISMRGYQPTFIATLRDGLRVLEGAIAAQEASTPVTGPGRRPELVRGWLVRQIRMTLECDGRMNVSSRQGARALSQCIRIILRSVGEPAPSDMRPLLNEARRP